LKSNHSLLKAHVNLITHAIFKDLMRPKEHHLDRSKYVTSSWTLGGNRILNGLVNQIQIK